MPYGGKVLLGIARQVKLPRQRKFRAQHSLLHHGQPVGPFLVGVVQNAVAPRHVQNLCVPGRAVAQAVRLPQLVGQAQRGLQSVIVKVLELNDGQAVIPGAGVDLGGRFAHGLGVGQNAALDAQQVLHGLQVGLPPCFVVFVAQRRGKRRDPHRLFAALQPNEQVVPQALAPVLRCQQVGAGGNAHPAQFKLPRQLVLVAVDVVDQPHGRLIHGHAVRAAVHTVDCRHFQRHKPQPVKGRGVGVGVGQPFVLRQALQRHPPPQRCLVVSLVQPVFYRKPPVRPRRAPLHQRVILAVGHHAFFAAGQVGHAPVRRAAQDQHRVAPDHLPRQAVRRKHRLGPRLAAHHAPLQQLALFGVERLPRAVQVLQLGGAGVLQAAVVLRKHRLAQLVHHGVGDALAGVLLVRGHPAEPGVKPSVDGASHGVAGNVRHSQRLFNVLNSAAVRQRPQQCVHRLASSFPVVVLSSTS